MHSWRRRAALGIIPTPEDTAPPIKVINPNFETPAPKQIEAPAAPEEPVTITGAYDSFKTNDAPYIIEERTNSFGGTYDKKVYTSEAYSDFMDKSDETGRRIRWGVTL